MIVNSHKACHKLLLTLSDNVSLWLLLAKCTVRLYLASDFFVGPWWQLFIQAATTNTTGDKEKKLLFFPKEVTQHSESFS